MNCVRSALIFTILIYLIFNCESVVHQVSTTNTTADCVCGKDNICIRKCCKLNYGIPDDVENCTHTGTENFEIGVITDNASPPNACFKYGVMNCGVDSNFFRLEPLDIPTDAFEIKSDNLLWTEEGPSYNSDEYCVENFEDIGLSAYVCIKPESIDSSHVYALGMLISLPFLFVTFLVHALLPVKTMHTKCLMCFVASLFCGYVSLTAIQFYGGADLTMCLIIGMFCVSNFMVSFLWTSVMSFDIWLTFSGIGGFSLNRKKAEQRRFIYYFIYAWSLGLLHITLIVLLNAYAPSDAFYNPLFGVDKCWFRDDMGVLLYFYGPLAIIIISNVIMFARTAWKIKQTQKDTKVLRQGENKSHAEDDQQRFKVYLKLLLAMGGNWSLEVLSWAWGWQIGEVPKILSYLIDLCNVLYGVLIFFMFTFKLTNWIQLQKRYACLRKIKPPKFCAKPGGKTEEIELS